jgi:catechol 2,3-dioxygenase-like lactoylglutathione lyase family enzyme
MITRLDHVHVVAKDMDASVAFYTKALGFTLLRHVRFGPDGSRQLCYVGLGDMMIELVQPAHADEFQGTEARPLGISVDDLDATVAHFQEEGIEVVGAPGRGFSFGGRQAVIRDPSGLLIEVRQWDSNDYPMSPDWQPERDDVTRIA